MARGRKISHNASFTLRCKVIIMQIMIMLIIITVAAGVEQEDAGL